MWYGSTEMETLSNIINITPRTEEQLCDEQAWSRMDDEGCPNVTSTGFEKDRMNMERHVSVEPTLDRSA